MTRKIKASDLLLFLGAGTLIGATIIAPGVARIALPILKGYLKRRDEAQNSVYNLWQLRRNLKYLQKQKLVSLSQKSGETIIKITQEGRERIIKYKFEQMKIPTPSKWDNKSRIINYDISSLKKSRRDMFRTKVKALGFLNLQESVYLYPYPCENEISFLREYFGVGEEIIFVEVSRLENDGPYKKYFGF